MSNIVCSNPSSTVYEGVLGLLVNWVEGTLEDYGRFSSISSNDGDGFEGLSSSHLWCTLSPFSSNAAKQVLGSSTQAAISFPHWKMEIIAYVPLFLLFI